MNRVKSTADFNSQEFCRTCAQCTNESLLIPAFDQIEITTKINNSLQLTDLLLLLNVQIEKDDGLPQQVCVKCVEQLTDFHTFRELCKESQTKLREILLKKEPSDSLANINVSQIEENISDNEIGKKELTLNDVCTLNDVQAVYPFASSSEDNTLNPEESNIDDEDSDDEEKTEVNSSEENTLDPGESDMDDEDSGDEDVRLEEITERPIRICHDCNKYGHSSRYTLDRQTCAYLKILKKFKFQVSSDSEFCCFYCDEKFESLEIIESHILVMHPIDNPFNCKICKESFWSIVELNEHVQKEHETTQNKKAEEKKIHKCDFCNKEFKLNCLLKTHRKKVHPNGNFECAVCFKKFTNAHKFNYHLKSHDKSKQYKCKYCGRTFMQNTHLQFHEEVHTNADRPYKCEVCGKDYIHRYQYKTHLRTHEGNFSHICEICGKGFPAAFMRNVHRRYHSSDYQCEFCGKKYNKSNLEIHLYKEHGEGQGQQCKLKSIKKSNKLGEYHRRYQLKKKLENKFYTCPLTVCSAKFEIPSALEKHMRVHDKNRKYKCDICHRSYITSNHLKEHINRVHSKIIHYDCSICDKRFYDKCTLKFHVRSHTEKYECTVCHKLLSISSIENHKRIHAQENKWICKICGQSFTTRIRLKSHYGKHSTEEKMNIEATILAENKDLVTLE